MTNEESPVIVVGAGLSGLAVALTAALRGRRSVVLEASDKIGGAAAWSGGQVWVGANHVAARAGIDDDLTRAEAYVRAIGAATYFPQTVFIDRAGHQVYVHAGPYLSASSLTRDIRFYVLR